MKMFPVLCSENSFEYSVRRSLRSQGSGFFGLLFEQVPPILLDKQYSDFTPDITPIILAAHTNNYEIIKLLVQKGVSMPQPHEVGKALCHGWWRLPAALSSSMVWRLLRGWYTGSRTWSMTSLKHLINDCDDLVKVSLCCVWCRRCAATVWSASPAQTWTAFGTPALASTSTELCPVPRWSPSPVKTRSLPPSGWAGNCRS